MIKVTLICNSGRKNVMASEDKTVREVLEENGIRYDTGITSIDGAALRPGEFDKTLSQLGIAEKCFLSNVVKADNAANVMIAGGAIVVTSSLKLEDIKRAKKFRPEALYLYEGEGADKEVVFAIDTTTRSHGTLDGNGAVFGPNATAEGNATITIVVNDLENVQKEFTERFGSGLLKLKKMEEYLPTVLAEIAADEAAVNEMITTM